jgi:peroxiredoxin/mono/diheme cytochrome c family protein
MATLTGIALLSLLPVDFALADANGKTRSLTEWHSHRIVVLAFLTAECPVSRLYAQRLEALATEFAPQGVAVIAIDPDGEDSASDLQKFATDLHLSYSILRDPKQNLAHRLSITRTPEVVVLDQSRYVRYQGRVDDQFSPGSHRAQLTRRDLAEALTDLLSGQPVRVNRTTPAGCPLTPLPKEPAVTAANNQKQVEVTYAEHLAPIIARRCVSCHRPGGIGPFSLEKPDDVFRRKKAIVEAIADGRMPPWHADPQFGKFANDPSLTENERQLFADWQKAGMPMGNKNTLASSADRIKNNGWNIAPDLVVSLPQPFAVPEKGLIPYQLFDVDPGFREDRWIREAEIRPTNRQVVHHATVFLRPPGADGLVVQGELESFCLAAYAMGTPPMILPQGMAKKVPAGWHLIFVVHYVAGGPDQFDQTQLGLHFAPAGSVQKEVATNILMAEHMTIPPHCSNHVETRSRKFEDNVLLLALFPHMHLRGVSFRYEATYPDGHTETLLSVPRWDMNWQHRYVFAEPKYLPAGTVLTAIGQYDNSENNPNNPDSNAEVHIGPQTEDEMFNGYYDYCLADKDLTKPNWRQRLRQPSLIVSGLGIFGLGLMLWRSRNRRHRIQAN